MVDVAIIYQSKRLGTVAFAPLDPSAPIDAAPSLAPMADFIADERHRVLQLTHGALDVARDRRPEPEGGARTADRVSFTVAA